MLADNRTFQKQFTTSKSVNRAKDDIKSKSRVSKHPVNQNSYHTHQFFWSSGSASAFCPIHGWKMMLYKCYAIFFHSDILKQNANTSCAYSDRFYAFSMFFDIGYVHTVSFEVWQPQLLTSLSLKLSHLEHLSCIQNTVNNCTVWT